MILTWREKDSQRKMNAKRKWINAWKEIISELILQIHNLFECFYLLCPVILEMVDIKHQLSLWHAGALER